MNTDINEPITDKKYPYNSNWLEYFPSVELNFVAIEAIGVAIIASITIYAAYFIQRNVMKNEWAKKQGEIYADWWENKDAKKIRKAIISDEAYLEILPVLQRRISKNNDGMVDSKEYEVIESIDQFLSILTRFREFDSQHMGHSRRGLWTRVFGHWIEKIETRDELCEYIVNFWKDVDLLRPPNYTLREKMKNWLYEIIKGKNPVL